MEIYNRCPKRYEALKIDKISEPSGREALVGIFVHRTLELLMQHPPQQRTIQTAKTCARQAWSEMEENQDFQLLELDEVSKRAFRWEGWQSVENYFLIEDPQTVDIVATEKWVQTDINGVPFRGIIDRLDRNRQDQIVVSDYKNGQIPKERYRASKWEQLAFYAAMIQNDMGVTPASGRLIFTAQGQILETRITKESINSVVNKASTTWENIQKDFFERGFKATPNPLCAWCQILPTCPEGISYCFMQLKAGKLKETSPGYETIKNLAS